MERLEDQECVRDAEVEKYREKIIDMVKLIKSKKLLKRIYDLAEYLYIYR